MAIGWRRRWTSSTSCSPVDIYLNETTSHADLILPTRVHAERANYDLVYTRTTSRNYARYSPRVVDPDPDLLDHWEVLLELTARLQGKLPGEVDAAYVDELIGKVTAPGTRCEDVASEVVLDAIGEEVGPQRILDLMLRSGPYGDRFADDEEGLSLAAIIEADGPVRSRAARAPAAAGAQDVRRTDSPGHDYLVQDVPRLRAALEERVDPGELLLVGRRQVRNMNSWLHNARVLAKGRNRCTLLVSNEDAERFGLATGGKARIASRSGELDVEGRGE